MKLADIQLWSKRKKILVLVIALVALALAVAAVTLWLMPYVRMLEDPVIQAQFEGWVKDMGFLGFLAMLGLQILQVVVAFIPGEVVQLMAGAMYGTWGGLGLCLLGCIIASSIVFALVRKLGRGFVVKLFGEEQLDKYTFLDDTSRLEVVVFILFLIPGMPKDVLTYIVPMSEIRMPTFIFLSSIARIPGMIASTIIGSSFAGANWPLIIGVFAVVIVLGGLSIYKKDAIMGWVKNR